jgi:hypothetical protein
LVDQSAEKPLRQAARRPTVRTGRLDSMNDAAKVEEIARELCRAARNNPDRTLRFGTRLTLNVDGC